MEIIANSTHKILTAILRHTSGALTIAIIGELLKMTHVGVWKALKKLESANMVILKATGNKKNSTYTVHLNWNNPLVEKTLALALEYEATLQRRWTINFAELESHVKFLILFGSILVNSKEARDIDVLAIVDKRAFKAIDEKILKIQLTQLKKIHLIDLTESEFNRELKRPNKAYLEAIKKGVVLFGQDKFVRFMKELQK